MNYDSMPAGREMDAMVAEKVFGKVRCQSEGHRGPNVEPEDDGKYCYAAKDSPRAGAECPLYSTNISDSFEIMDKFSKGEGMPGVWKNNRGLWAASMRPINGEVFGWAEADTAPLAICRASLRAHDKEGGR